ncbi:MAG: hypothetical protein AAGB97_09360 [Dehalococcoidia bacterium]
MGEGEKAEQYRTGYNTQDSRRNQKCPETGHPLGDEVAIEYVDHREDSGAKYRGIGPIQRRSSLVAQGLVPCRCLPRINLGAT